MSEVKRTLIVTGQKPITTMKRGNGGQTTLYEVYATDEAGEIVEQPLRAFQTLEEGKPVEYTVSRYNHPQHGTSYTLTPPTRAPSAQRISELEEAVDRLKGEVRVLLLWAESHGMQSAGSEDSKATPAPEQPALDDKYGEKPPWDDDDQPPEQEDHEI